MKAFDDIYNANYRSLQRVAKKMIGNVEEVPDILQDIFTDFYSKTNNGSVIQNPGSWLYKATVNKCIDSLRKRRRFLSVEPLTALKSEEEIIDNPDLKKILEYAVARLKPREKALVTLYSEGLSYREMSAATGIRFSSIGKVLSRTLKKLEKELKPHKYELY